MPDIEKDDFLNWEPASSNPQKFYLDAAADSISYLLTSEIDRSRTTFPLNFLNCERIGIGEIGWGKANFYTSGDVLLISKALNDLDYDLISSRYNADYFNTQKIFPNKYIWSEIDKIELLAKLKDLRTYVDDVAKQGLGFYIVAV